LTITYTTVQAAVDAAGEGDMVKVAGYCAGVEYRAGLPQTVYVSKTITLRGGYTTTNWTTSDPQAHPTTLDAQGQGRAVYVTGTVSPTIEGLRITGGDASGLGGGYWELDAGGGVYVITATAVLANNQVFSNTAMDGGGVYLGNSDGRLSNNDIYSNTTNSACGGVCLYHSGATLDGNIIYSNAAYDGGGVCLQESGNAILNGNIIRDNSATVGASGYGGGLYINYSDAEMVNNVVIGNRANTAGSGIYVYESAPSLWHTTIHDNTGGNGSGISAFSVSNVVLTNTILTSQTVGLSVDAQTDATLNGVLWYNNGTNTSGAVTNFTVNNPLTGTPAFAADGYHLTAGSSAIDQGVNSGVEDDIDGDPRPQGEAPDLGADEVEAGAEAGLVVTKRADPDPVQAGGDLV